MTLKCVSETFYIVCLEDSAWWNILMKHYFNLVCPSGNVYLAHSINVSVTAPPMALSGSRAKLSMPRFMRHIGKWKCNSFLCGPELLCKDVVRIQKVLYSHKRFCTHMNPLFSTEQELISHLIPHFQIVSRKRRSRYSCLEANTTPTFLYFPCFSEQTNESSMSDPGAKWTQYIHWMKATSCH